MQRTSIEQHINAQTGEVTTREVIEEVPVPSSVTPFQARKALIQSNLYDQVEQVVAQADSTVRVAWEYGLSVERHSPFIEAIKPVLGLTDEQIDNLFILAETL